MKITNRRSFLRSASLGAMGSIIVSKMAKSITATNIVNVGAIRWDAWYEHGSIVGDSVENSLSPPEFHHRLPFFSKIISQNQIIIDGNHQEVFDKEIRAAVDQNLQFWAYCWYNNDSKFRNGWKLHQSSAIRSEINWCMILQSSNLRSVNDFENMFTEFMSYFKYDNYQTVENKRPLLFLLVDDVEGLFHAWGNDLEFLWKSLRKLKNSCMRFIQSEPYVVVMRGDPFEARRLMNLIGGDAISNYMVPVKRNGMLSYAELDVQEKLYWRKMILTESQTVPIVQTGWDNRPRQLHPPLWQGFVRDEGELTNYYKEGSSDAIKQSIEDSRNFVRKNPRLCKSNTVLVYSWNECDEGGSCLIPKISDVP